MNLFKRNLSRNLRNIYPLPFMNSNLNFINFLFSPKQFEHCNSFSINQYYQLTYRILEQISQMYFTPRPFVTIYSPVLPSLSLSQIMAAALAKSFQQYSCMYTASIKKTQDKEERYSEFGETTTCKSNSLQLIEQGTGKAQKVVEAKNRKELEDLKTQNKSCVPKENSKRQSFLKGKTNIIRVLKAQSQQQEDPEITQNEDEINFKNKSESNIQDLKRTTRKQKKIRKDKTIKCTSDTNKHSYLVVVPTVCQIETIELPKKLLDQQQIKRKKNGLIQRMVAQQKNSQMGQKQKRYMNRERREMKKLF